MVTEMIKFIIILEICLFCIYIFAIYMLHRNNIVYNNRLKIVQAIYDYQMDMIRKSCVEEVDYDDIESYDRTLWRLYDFGCENILPKEKYEIIKPYL